MSRFGSFLKSSPIISMFAGFLSTGCYVSYKDHSRLRRMVNTYKTGSILDPVSENEYEIAYHERFYDEKNIKSILNPVFSNEYYIINGGVGVGKSRILRKVVSDLIHTNGEKKEGAPIYVSAEQGKTFPDTLAKAVNFHFDEHINFLSFVDIFFKIESLPSRDEKSKLTRVLDAIEESACLYVAKYKKPVVLVIDNLPLLHKKMPDAISDLQEKAKFWADCNIVKLVFVNNDETIDLVLQKNSCSWSRVASPIFINDLSKEEAIKFLTSTPIFENDKRENLCKGSPITVKEAEKIVQLVGGRILDLITFKTKHREGTPIQEIEMEMIQREQEKFVNISKSPHLWKVVSKLREMPGKTMKLSKLIKYFCKKDVDSVCDLNIIRYAIIIITVKNK